MKYPLYIYNDRLLCIYFVTNMYEFAKQNGEPVFTNVNFMQCLAGHLFSKQDHFVISISFWLWSQSHGILLNVGRFKSCNSQMVNKCYLFPLYFVAIISVLFNLSVCVLLLSTFCLSVHQASYHKSWLLTAAYLLI